MCGICGIALPDQSSKLISESTLERMRDSMTHRGPDGYGSFIERGIALGHRRLSIVDVAHGAQPMSSVDDALRIVYNGEVFNHPMLSEELRADGVKYKTHCDTETVLHVYERERSRTPQRLRGMFAFAIWDRRERELFIARDRFGVKPLYYALLPDGSLYFASEIKAILASGAVQPRLNMAMLPDYLANHAPSGDETLFEGIKRLPAGHTLSWKNGEMKIEQFWDLHFNHSPTTDAQDERELVAEYRDRLREAVRLRLMADVPLGSFLSGGIDSAAITALMSELTGGGVKTFSVAFNEREANEFEYARLLANRYKTDHHEIIVSPNEFFGALPDLAWHEDEPIAHPSSIPLNFVSRLAAQHVKVVLTGEGSDETLAGYNRYRVTIYNMALGRRYERMTVPSLRAAVKSGIESLPAGVALRQKLSRTFFTRPASLTDLYFENFAVFGRARQAQVLSASTKDAVRGIDPYAAYEHALAQTDATTLLDRLLYADTKTYLHELLMKQDQMSMAASIESRVPFLDHPLVEFASGLPERLKLRGLTTKWVLRESMKDLLPPEILSRKKMGFPVPVGAWFRGPYRNVVDEYVLGPRAMARGLFDPTAIRGLVEAHVRGENHAERLWSLVNLEMWHRIFIDGEPREAMRVTGRTDGMHILWLKTELLHPVDKGGRIRTYQMLRELKKLHRITYLTLDDGTASDDAIARATEYCHEVIRVPFRTASKRSARFWGELAGNVVSRLPYAIAKYRVPALTTALRERVRRGDIDVVLCDFLSPSINVPSDLGVPIVLFQHNVEAAIWERHTQVASGAMKRAYMGEQWRRMRRFEGAECRRFNDVIAVSADDCRNLERAYDLSEVFEVPTGVDTDFFRPSGDIARNPHEMVFTGSMDWLPNEDGVTWFCDEILPRIRRSIPEATLRIVGRSPSRIVQDLAKKHDGVEVTGSVPDVRPHMERAGVFVIPLRIGGGTRLKVYEAMGMEIPIVSTTVGAEGLPVRDDEELLIADTPDVFAAATVRLIRDAALGTRIAHTAAVRVRAEFGWREAAARFAAICERAAEQYASDHEPSRPVVDTRLNASA